MCSQFSSSKNVHTCPSAENNDKIHVHVHNSVKPCKYCSTTVVEAHGGNGLTTSNHCGHASGHSSLSAWW